jgi:DNA-binding protein H-NS
MLYAMQIVEGCPTRVGRMTTNPLAAQRAAMRAPNGYVEEYGRGVVWTRGQGWAPHFAPRVAAIRT